MHGTSAWLRTLLTFSYSQSSVILRQQVRTCFPRASRHLCAIPHSPSTAPAVFTIYYNDVYKVPLPPNHRFPMQKYEDVRRRIQAVIHSSSNEEEGDDDPTFCVSPMVSLTDLETTHCSDYIARFLRGDQTETEQRNVGFPWSPAGVRRALSSTGGTVAAALAAADSSGWAAHVAGGTHHAFFDYGEGFCVFSDIAVAANVVRQRYPDRIRRVLILDLDVHQGNGNAVLFQDDPDVFTFSMHCCANYFSKKESSDLDIELPSGCTDATYLATLRHWLKRLKEEAGPFDFVFYQAGVDILHCDRLGRMEVSPEGVARRDQLVFEFCRELGVPLTITMGGGYPKSTVEWEPIIEAHANVCIEAYLFRKSWIHSLAERPA